MKHFGFQPQFSGYFADYLQTFGLSDASQRGGFHTGRSDGGVGSVSPGGHTEPVATDVHRQISGWKKASVDPSSPTCSVAVSTDYC